MAGRLNRAWLWIPSLYFIEGLPYFIVNQISIIMFTDLGLSKAEMAFFTSLLYIPWVIKPFWSPFVDIFRTKKWWILSMQAFMALCFILLAFSIPNPTKDMIDSSSSPISLFVISIILFSLTAFASATHDIAADAYYIVKMPEDDQSFFVGIRSTFYRLSAWFGQAVLVAVAVLLEKNMQSITTHTIAFLHRVCHIDFVFNRLDISLAWSLLFILLAFLFAIVALYHSIVLKDDSAQAQLSQSDFAQITTSQIDSLQVVRKNTNEIIKDFVHAFTTFFTKKDVLIALLFILFFRLPEALMLKLVYPFFTDSLENGGLALSAELYALVYGTFGILALTIGGIVGGIVASKYGLKKVLWPMFLALILPSLAYVYLSIFPTSNIYLLSSLIAIEQFGYGFGFQAYMLYMLFFSKGNYSASHYAICTGFMALGMMLPGMVAGYIYEYSGYIAFFSISMATALLSLFATFMVSKKLNH